MFKFAPLPLTGSLLLVFLTFLNFSLAAQGPTNVSGTINANTSWTLSGSPYVVTNVVTVAEGVTLTIEPGVVVKHDFSSQYDILIVEGTLISQGTTENPIVFTDIKDDAYGGDTNNDGAASVPSPGDWSGVRIQSTSGNTSILQHCLFRFGGYAQRGNASVEISGASPLVDNNHFYRSAKGITITSGGAPIISNNSFEENTEAPINLALNANPTFSNNTFVNNAINAIGIETYDYDNSGDSYTLSPISIAGINNIAYVVQQNGLTIGQGVTLTIEPGVVIKHDYSDFYDLILVEGALIAQGTPESPIVFTDIKDDTYGGDTNNDGGATTPTPGDWNGIGIQSTSGNTSILQHCLFRFGGYASWRSANVKISGASPLVDNNHFYQSSKGISITGDGTPTISNNRFEENIEAPISISLDANPSFNNNTFVNNDINAIGIEAYDYDNAGDSYILSPISIAGINNIPYVVQQNGLIIGQGVTLTIEPSVVIKHDYSDFYDLIQVEGTLIAQGTPENPIVFTDIKDDEYGGDANNDGTATFPSPGDWNGISIQSTSGNTSILQHCLFRFGGYASWRSANVKISGASPLVDNNHFYQSSKGISITGDGTPIISNNRFEENTEAPISISLDANPSFNNNTFVNNDINAIGIEAYDYDNAGASYTLSSTSVAGISNIPYVVQGNDLIIGQGVTLTIEPGVVIKHDFSSFYDLIQVEGTLIAQGNPENPIVFTDIKDDAYGGDTNNDGTATSPSPGDWSGISIQSTSGNTSILQHCLFRFGGYASWRSASVKISGSSPLVDNNHFHQSSKGISVTSNGAPIISNNLFEENAEAPINLALNADPTFDNNSFVNNAINAIGIEAYNYNSSGESYTLPSRTIAGIANIPYIVQDNGWIIGQGVTLTIESGVVVKHDYSSYYDMLQVEGTLIARGTPQDPIVFTDIKDDEYGGDTNTNGTASLPQAGDWRSINFQASGDSTSILEHCLFRFGGYGDVGAVALSDSIDLQKCQFLYNDLGLGVNNGGIAHLDSCRFEGNNYGIRKTGGIVTVKNSNLLDNGQYAIFNGTTDTIDARLNWWGDASGPYHSTNIDGTGNPVSDYVLFEPFLFQEVEEADTTVVTGCPDFDIILADQSEVDAFVQTYSMLCDSIFGSLTISRNVTDISGLVFLTYIGGNLRMSDNDHLTDFSGLSQLTTIGGQLYLAYNDALTSLSGLSNITSVGNGVIIRSNSTLSDCAALCDLLNQGGVAGNIYISDNPGECFTVAAVQSSCTGDGNPPALNIENLPASLEEGGLLEFEITTNFPPVNDLAINVVSSNALEVPLSSPVVMAANTASVPISVQLPDDAIAEIDELVSITAGASNYASASASFMLTEQEDMPGIELIITSSTISESAGLYATEAILRRVGVSSSAGVTVDIEASQAGQLYLPSRLSLAPGQSERTFYIGVLDNNLVDGTRSIDITAAVLLSSCNCNAPAGSDGHTTAAVQIVDNDGPSLTLLASPLALQEGIPDAGTLTVQRNTPTDTDLLVNLEVSDETEIQLPASVTIPQGAASVEIPITAIADGTADGNQQVSIQATATDFSPGIVWVIVTDINKPDLQIAQVSTAEVDIPAQDQFPFTVAIINDGFATAPSGIPLEGYLSEDDQLDDNDYLVGSYTTNKPITVGDTLEFIGLGTTPAQPKQYQLLFRVNPEQEYTEILYFNNTSAAVMLNVLPDYYGSATVDESVFVQGDEVVIYGSSFTSDEIPVPNAALDVLISVGEVQRSISVVTDAAGDYSLVFTPLPKEAGHFEIRANYPGQNGKQAQDSFDILGVEINNGEPFKWEVLLNQPVSSSVSIKNLSNVPLTNLAVSPVSLPNGCSLSFDDIPLLEGNASLPLNYSITGSEVTPMGENPEIELLISTNEGVAQAWTSDYLCQELAAHLSASISNINTTYSKDKASYFEFELYNIGLGGTGDITVDIPDVEWMKLTSPQVMPNIPLGDTGLVILQLVPSEELPLNTPATGRLVISAENGNSINIPFTVEKVSEAVGNVLVDVIDEYTYYTDEAPHLAGAQVTISHYFTGEVFAQGETDEDGQLLAENLPEGTLRIRVQAPSHESYDGIVIVRPGMTVDKVVFISYQAVSFTWDVVPTTIEDNYQIDLIMEFETNVPVPVVTMDFPDTLPQLFGNDTYPFFITLTNHGLITANDVQLNLPDDAEYEFVTNYVTQDLPALSAIQVPVTMRRRSEQERLAHEGSGLTVESISRKLDMDIDQMNKHFLEKSMEDCPFAVIVYTYECGENDVGKSTGKKVIIAGRSGNCGFGIWNPIGCSNCGGGAYSTVPSKATFDGCNNCLTKLGLTVLGCLPTPAGTGYGYIGCIVNFSVLGCAGSLVSAAASAAPTPYVKVPGLLAGCALSLLSAAIDCGYEPSPPPSARLDALSSITSFPAILQQPMDDIHIYSQAFEALGNIGHQYFGPLVENENVVDFAALVDPYVSATEMIDQNTRTSIQIAMEGYDISETEINNFIDRWNTTVQAWGAGIYAPNATYPEIVDKDLLDAYFAQIQAAVDRASERDFPDVETMVVTAMEDVYTLTQPSADPDEERAVNSVCASVTINISQQLTMTREAFEGTLTVYNGHPGIPIENLALNLEILNENGVPSNDLFEIETTDLDQLTGIDGTGTLSASQEGTATILFIPEPAAAPEVPQSYSFGGTISYLDPFSGTVVTLPLSPVTLQVNPSPDLFLHYFMQRDILGDDALTDPVEPIIPADLAVMVENNGYGVAQNVVISSAQPEIIENEKGLAVNFSLIGSNLQGEPAKLGVTNINFGNIDPFKTKIGQWYFTSDLLGHFVDYRTELVHLDSRGNPDLSLISGTQLHELIRTISVYGSAEDGIDDFLVNETPDAEDLPDAIYLSQGNLVYDVFAAETANFSGDITAPGHTTILEVDPSLVGWNYVKLDDPGDGNFELVSVTRSDGQVISLKNAWLTHVTIPDRSTPIYENKFHLVDDFAGFDPVTYTVVWKGKNPDPLTITSIIGYPEEVTSEQVTELTVTFNKAIDISTFTHEDLMMQLQGGGNIINETVLITPIDARTFTIDLSSLTTGNGYYLFTAQAAGIKDATGAFGETGEQISWTQFLSVPVVKSFGGIPDSRISSAYSSVELLFNLPIDVSTLTPARFSILKDGNPQAGTFTVTSLNPENTLFELAGLEQFMDEDGAYELTIDLPNIQTPEGVPGLVIQSIILTLDTQGPQLTNMVQRNAGALDDQHYTGINLSFSEAIQLIEPDAVELRKNGILQDLSSIEIEAINDDWQQVKKFGVLTYPEGNYTFSIDLSKVKDLADNSGSGVESISWTVNRTTGLTISNLLITPDRGFSAVDGITSTRELTVSFDIDEAAQDIRLYQNDNGTLRLLNTVSNAGPGQVTIPAVFATGGKTALKIRLLDSEGNLVEADLALYIDETNLSASWLQPQAQVLSVHPAELVLEFSAPVLDEGALTGSAIKLTRNGNTVNTDIWSLVRLTDTTYQVLGLSQLQADMGTYQLTVDLRAFQKYSSGASGMGTTSISWEIIQANRPPIADAGPDMLLAIPQNYTLDASGSVDLDGDDLTYQWYPPTSILLDDEAAAQPSFTISQANHRQDYQFLLSVSDGQEFNTDVVDVSIVLNDSIAVSSLDQNIFCSKADFTLNWEVFGDVNEVDIRLSGDGGTTYPTLLAMDISPDQSPYPLVISDITGDNFVLKLEQTDGVASISEVFYINDGSEFMTIGTPTITQPTIETPTGTIVVQASGTGPLEYSVDAGQNWSPSNTFSGLAPDIYEIEVRLEGDADCTTTYAGNPVMVEEVPGPPCNIPADHSMNADTLQDGTYRAANTIVFTGGVLSDGGEVTVTAGNSIRLLPGFQAEAGSQFSAYIEDCTEVSSSREEVEISGLAERSNVFEPANIQLRSFPNPFRHRTTIEYYLPDTGPVTLVVTDLNGQVVTSIVDGTVKEAGWQRLDFGDPQLQAGLYILSLRTQQEMVTEKLFLLR